MPTETEVKTRLCALMCEVSAALVDYSEPTDCFCANGVYAGRDDYRNSGTAIEFIESLVRPAIDAMKRVREQERERAKVRWENAAP